MANRGDHTLSSQDLVKLRVAQLVEGGYRLHVDVAHDVLLSSSHRPLAAPFMLLAHQWIIDESCGGSTDARLSKNGDSEVEPR
jgi:hypothetical protein